EAEDRQHEEAHEGEPPSGACKARRQQQEAKDSDQNHNIGRERKDAQKLRKDEEHECITDRRSSAPPLNLVSSETACALVLAPQISEVAPFQLTGSVALAAAKQPDRRLRESQKLRCTGEKN